MKIQSSLIINLAYLNSNYTQKYIKNIIDNSYNYSDYHALLEQMYFQHDLPDQVSKEKYEEISEDFEKSGSDQGFYWWRHNLPPSEYLVFEEVCRHRGKYHPDNINYNTLLETARKNTQTKNLYRHDDKTLLDPERLQKVLQLSTETLRENLEEASLWQELITEDSRKTYNEIIDNWENEILFQTGVIYFQVEDTLKELLSEVKSC